MYNKYIMLWICLSYIDILTGNGRGLYHLYKWQLKDELYYVYTTLLTTVKYFLFFEMLVKVLFNNSGLVYRNYGVLIDNEK